MSSFFKYVAPDCRREGTSPSLQSEPGWGTRSLFSGCYQNFPWAAGPNSALTAVFNTHAPLWVILKKCLSITFHIYLQAGAVASVLSHCRGRSSRAAKKATVLSFVCFFSSQLRLSYSAWHKVNIWREFLHSTHCNFRDILQHLLHPKEEKYVQNVFSFLLESELSTFSHTEKVVCCSQTNLCACSCPSHLFLDLILLLAKIH